MRDSMVEADIHRLSKAAAEANSPRERREILALAEQKLAVLTASRLERRTGKRDNG